MARRGVAKTAAHAQLGLGGPGHGPVFGTPFGQNLNSVLVSVSVYLGHGSVRS